MMFYGIINSKMSDGDVNAVFPSLSFFPIVSFNRIEQSISFFADSDKIILVFKFIIGFKSLTTDTHSLSQLFAHNQM